MWMQKMRSKRQPGEEKVETETFEYLMDEECK